MKTGFEKTILVLLFTFMVMAGIPATISIAEPPPPTNTHKVTVYHDPY